jgi:hypothetical protein
MRSSTTPSFWRAYADLPAEIRERARRAYRLWRVDPRHPSLRFKKIGDLWVVRVDPDHRALGLMIGDTIQWFWIGSHDDYERLLDELT